MARVTLSEAYEILAKKEKNLRKKSAYKSVIDTRIKEDEEYVEKIKKLYEDIKNAERISGIDLILERIRILEYTKNFYDTSKGNIYEVSKYDREYIKSKHSIIKEDIEFLAEKVKNLGQQVYIEIWVQETINFQN